MDSTNPKKPLTRDEQEFWDKAALVAEFPTLLENGTQLPPTGAAHIARDYASALLVERRLVQSEGV